MKSGLAGRSDKNNRKCDRHGFVVRTGTPAFNTRSDQADMSDSSESWASVDALEECREPNSSGNINIAVRKQESVPLKSIGSWASYPRHYSPPLKSYDHDTYDILFEKTISNMILHDPLQTWLSEPEWFGAYSLYEPLLRSKNLHLPIELPAGGIGDLDKRIGEIKLTKTPMSSRGATGRTAGSGQTIEPPTTGGSGSKSSKGKLPIESGGNGGDSSDEKKEDDGKEQSTNGKSAEAEKEKMYPCIFCVADFKNHAMCVTQRFAEPSHLINHLVTKHGFEKNDKKMYLVEPKFGVDRPRRAICIAHKCWMAFEDFESLETHNECHSSNTRVDRSGISGQNKWLMMFAWFGFRQKADDFGNPPWKAFQPDRVEPITPEAVSSSNLAPVSDPSRTIMSTMPRKRAGESSEAESPVLKRRQSESHQKIDGSDSTRHVENMSGANTGFSKETIEIEVDSPKSYGRSPQADQTSLMEVVNTNSDPEPGILPRIDSPHLTSTHSEIRITANESDTNHEEDPFVQYTQGSDFEFSMDGRNTKTPSSHSPAYS